MLTRFLRDWLGEWPAPTGELVVVGADARLRPRWDGGEQRAVGVTDAQGSGVLSVPPQHVDAVRELLATETRERLAEALPDLLDRPGQRWFTGVFRATTTPTRLADAGNWESGGTAAVPEWLRPFPGEVLIARDPLTGAYLAGVGLKPHSAFGVEISVGTEEHARGRGLARRLVARAARRIVEHGAVALYLHDPANDASARVADAAGFPDLGWHIHALSGVLG